MKFSLIASVSLFFSIIPMQNVYSEGIAQQVFKNKSLQGDYQTDNSSDGSLNNSQSNSTANASNQNNTGKTGKYGVSVSIKKQMSMEDVIFSFFKADCRCRILYTYEGLKYYKMIMGDLNDENSISQYCSLGDFGMFELSMSLALILDSYHIKIMENNITSLNDGYKKIVPVFLIPNDQSEDPIDFELVMRNTSQLGWVIDIEASDL